MLLNCTVYLVCCGVLCGKLLVAAAACWHQPPFLSPPTLSVAGLVGGLVEFGLSLQVATRDEEIVDADYGNVAVAIRQAVRCTSPAARRTEFATCPVGQMTYAALS